MGDYDDKTLLLVGTGGVKRRAVLERLRALGLRRIVCLHDERNWADPYVDEWIIADAVHPDGDALATTRERLARGEMRFDGVLTYDEYSVVVAAHLARALGHVGTPPGVAETAKDKAAFRRFCRERGLPSPRTCSLRIDNALDVSAIAKLAFPVVLKPVFGAGSVFVRRVDTLDELRAAVADYAARIRTSDVAKLWPEPTLLVEEYLEGDEVDIDMLVQGGEVKYLAITDNLPAREPHFLEVGGLIPSALPLHAQQALASMATDVLRALGVTDSCVHFEAKWTPSGPVPIEVNLRIGGAEVYAFNRGAWGVDLVEGAARIALGLDARSVDTRTPREHLASAAFNPPHAGRVVSIDVDDDVSRSSDLAELCLFKQAGDRIEVPPRGYEYSGWIVARGATPERARANLARLVAGVHIDIEPDA